MFLFLNFQLVQDEYTNGCWTKHHTQMLVYVETNAKSPKPSISVTVSEPADYKEKKWKVTIISANSVSLFEVFIFH